MSKNQTIDVNGALVTIHQQGGSDYISLTDIANAKEGDGRAADIIKNWIRNRWNFGVSLPQLTKER